MLNKALLLMAGDQMKGTHRITVGYTTAWDDPIYGWMSSLNVGKMEPQKIGGFPIITFYTWALTGFPTVWIHFIKNFNINFQNITVTRMDNQKSISLSVAVQGESYSTSGQLFQEEDVGKTIDLIIEAT